MRVHMKAALVLVGACTFYSIGAAINSPFADAHTLTGGSAQATCTDNVVTVNWTFTSTNATGHHIVSASFNRSVDSSAHTADTVTAATHETAGKTVSLTAAVAWEDGVTSSKTVTTAIPTDICPVTTTTTTVVATTTTVAETTTTVPEFVPPTTITPNPPTTICLSGSHPFEPVKPVTDVNPCVLDATPIVHGTPTAVARVVPSTPATGLPVTGAGNDILVIGGIALMVTGLLAMAFVTRRRGVS